MPPPVCVCSSSAAWIPFLSFPFKIFPASFFSSPLFYFYYRSSSFFVIYGLAYCAVLLGFGVHFFLFFLFFFSEYCFSHFGGGRLSCDHGWIPGGSIKVCQRINQINQPAPSFRLLQYSLRHRQKKQFSSAGMARYTHCFRCGRAGGIGL